ncbi:MAG: hypothetical protein DRH32_02220 [Deltaproteobacteria bacterium]|nr:MAG: hypothetical protein DRH32_02220 [Deltaproteobacteria bacterium]
MIVVHELLFPQDRSRTVPCFRGKSPAYCGLFPDGHGSCAIRLPVLSCRTAGMRCPVFPQLFFIRINNA